VTKITPEHLTRGAYIYIRQSTADQLLHNHESRRRQYGLADRARHLGWQDVVVIDDDLGRSGSGVSRPGFERLLAAICEGRVGSVFAIEVSRLAPKGLSPDNRIIRLAASVRWCSSTHHGRKRV
jgi:DNA invertase Pin-like site-specific DNA recombinase